MSRRFNFGGVLNSPSSQTKIGTYLNEKDPGIYSLAALAFNYAEWDVRPLNVDPAAFYITAARLHAQSGTQTGPNNTNIASQIGTGVGDVPASYLLSGSGTGYQTITLPADGDYRFTLEGGRGGTSLDTTAAYAGIAGWNHLQVGSQRKAARGAKVVSTFSLSAGDQITMVVGQHGSDDPYNGSNPGGGGGTYVTLGSYANVQAETDTLLAVAGGAGGYAGDGGQDNYTTGEGQATTGNTGANSSASGSSGAGAINASNSNNSGGGGGYFTSSSGGTTKNFTGNELTGVVAYGFRRGAHGAEHIQNSTGGGFGGGGGGSAQTGNDDDKGGGGGYSGGGYAFDAYAFGSGGGSFVSGLGTNSTLQRGGAQYTNGATGVAVIGFGTVSGGNGSIYIEFGF